MRRRFVQIQGELVEVGADYVPQPRAEFHVMPDIEPFRANDGAVIKGRAHFREHLKATGSMELGSSDIRRMEENHAKRKAAHQARLQAAALVASSAPSVDVTQAPLSPSRIRAAVLNRLHNRPAPDRKTLIKINLEEARRRR